MVKNNITFKLNIVTESIKRDPEMYYGFQSNIAMAFQDEYRRHSKEYKNRKDIHKISNNAAKNFLDMWIAQTDS